MVSSPFDQKDVPKTRAETGEVLQFATGTSSIGRDGLSAFRLEPGDGGDGPGWAGAMREERGLAAREFREQVRRRKCQALDVASSAGRGRRWKK